MIDKNYWGTSALTLEFLKNIIIEKIKHPRHQVWWFLISKGYKTYLLMANNFHQYYPRYDKATPKKYKDLISRLAKSVYPDNYNETTGTIEFQDNHDKLKNYVAPITEKMCEANPKINFFSQQNPNWANGTELACISKVSFSLAITHPFKIIKKYFLKQISRFKNESFS